MSATAAVGRNSPCPCGSGRKVKRCHGVEAAVAMATGGRTRPLAGRAPDPAGRVTSPAAAPDAGSTARDADAASDVREQARQLLAEDRLDEAMAIAERLLAADPDDALALAVLGTVARRVGDAAVAGELLLRAIRRDPSDGAARRELVSLLLSVGLVTEAEAEVERALAAHPDDAGAVGDLAAVRTAQGRAAEAEALLRRAIRTDPESVATRRALVGLLMQHDRLAEAAAEYRSLDEVNRRLHAAVRSHPGGHPMAGPVASVADGCNRTGGEHRVLRPAADIAVHRARFLPAATAPEPVIARGPERYAAILPDATAIGGEVAVVARDGTILCDAAVHPDAERYDLVRGALCYMDRRRALLDLASEDAAPIDAAVALTSPAGANYYHWLIEQLARFEVLEAVAPETSAWPVLVDAASARVPQLVAALRMLLGPERRLRVVGPREPVRAARLAVASPGAWVPIDLRDGLMLRPHDTVVDPGAVAFLRERLMSPGQRDAGPGTRRLFLARSRTTRLLNAPELEPVLAARGFETVLPEALSFEDQVELFSHAGIVVVETGAALTNLVFAPPQARFLVLAAGAWDITVFSQLAAICGQHLAYLAGEIVLPRRKVYQSGFRVTPAALRAALDQVEGS